MERNERNTFGTAIGSVKGARFVCASFAFSWRIAAKGNTDEIENVLSFSTFVVPAFGHESKSPRGRPISKTIRMCAKPDTEARSRCRISKFRAVASRTELET